MSNIWEEVQELSFGVHDEPVQVVALVSYLPVYWCYIPKDVGLV
jgi:hypothetical protein